MCCMLVENVVCVCALLKVTYRLTYDDVEDMLANGIAGSADEWELGRLDKLAQLRHRYLRSTCSSYNVVVDEKTKKHLGLHGAAAALEIRSTCEGGCLA